MNERIEELASNYENEVIEAARRGLAWSNVALTPEMEKLLRIVYNAGYEQAKIDAMLLVLNNKEIEE